VLSAKQGDQQSRAELLGHMLNAAGFQPFILRHGTRRDEYHLIVLRLDDDAIQALAKELGRPLETVRVGTVSAIALPLEPEAGIGTVAPAYYDAENGRWTASIAFRRLR
jgi:hypothetical protein